MDSYSYLMELEEYYPTFNLENAICNHGFFMMAPNQWNPSTKSFSRPLRLSDYVTSVNVSISQPHQFFLHICIHLSPGQNDLSTDDYNAIKKQVKRMLRISKKDERDVREFQEMHEKAKKKGFGRLFRSPSLFEDCIKSFLLCNTTWDRSLSMAQSLCEVQAEVNIRKVGETWVGNNNFPNSKEIADMDIEMLRRRCKVGYRAKYIVKFAREVESGILQLDELELEQAALIGSKAGGFKRLMKMEGIGYYTCANIAMCMGFYENVPVDTQTTALLHTTHRKIVQQFYHNFAPFQCLAYWFQLLESYEDRYGKLSQMEQCDYHKVKLT